MLLRILAPDQGRRDRRSDELRREASLKVAGSLVPEVDVMIGELVVEMAKRALPAS
ncbi:MAG: hypothetical protein ACTSVG_12850 [Alphaproteobacteria bacterium]